MSTRDKEPCRVLVFAKAPIVGEVKTRLFRVLGADAATSLYRRLIRRALAVAVEADVGRVELWCGSNAAHPFFSWCARHYGVTLREQRSGDLGARMHDALESTLLQSDRAVLMGADCPTLTPACLRQTDFWLRTDCELVLGPAEDGGYVLIGMKAAWREVFHGVSWGSEDVLRQTRRCLAETGRGWRELPVAWDVDRAEDYRRLVTEGRLKQLPPDQAG
jgi:rSAM/selenodomain-associated transferase 1